MTISIDFDGIGEVCFAKYCKNSKRKKRIVVKLGGSVQLSMCEIPSENILVSTPLLFFCGKPTIRNSYGLVRYRALHSCIRRGDCMELEASKRFSLWTIRLKSIEGIRETLHRQ